MVSGAQYVFGKHRLLFFVLFFGFLFLHVIVVIIKEVFFFLF